MSVQLKTTLRKGDASRRRIITAQQQKFSDARSNNFLRIGIGVMRFLAIEKSCSGDWARSIATAALGAWDV
jgi:hypothetical protein